MCDLTLADWMDGQAEGTSFSEEIFTLAPTLYNELGSPDHEVVDFLLKSNYGDRCLYPKYADRTYAQMARILYLYKNEFWAAIAEYLALPSDSPKKGRTISEIIEDITSGSKDVTTTAQIKPMNTAVFVDKDNNLVVETTSGNGDKTRSMTEEFFDVIADSAKKINTVKTGALHQVLADTASFMTLSLY